MGSAASLATKSFVLCQRQASVMMAARFECCGAHADGATIIREGHGTGEGRGTSPGEVHDISLKAAETDATKRALATFGKPFGLALYGSGKTAPSPYISMSKPKSVDQGHHQVRLLSRGHPIFPSKLCCL